MGNLSFALLNFSLAAAIAAIVAAGGVLLRPLAGRSSDPLGHATAAALSAGGLGFVVFVFVAAGLVGRLWWSAAALLWLAIAGLVARVSGPSERRRFSIPKVSWRILPAALFLAWVLAFDLLMCFDPRFHSDALWYHLTLPYRWVSGGGFTADRSAAPSGYPLLAEMFYAVPVSFGLPFAARIIHLAFGVGVVVVIFSHLRAKLSPAGALALASAFFVFDSVNEVGAWANTDLARTFFLVAAAALLSAYAEGGDRRRLFLGAVIAGFSMATHYMAVVFGGFLLGAALAVATAGRGAKRIAGDVGIFWLLAAVIFSPWLAKNLVLYGDPFFGLAGTNFRVPSLQVLGRFFAGNVFFVGFSAAAVAALWRRKSDGGLRFLAAYLLVYLVAGMFEMPPIPRFFFPVYAVGLMIAGDLCAPLFERRRRLEVAIPAVLLAAAVAMSCYQLRQGMFDGALEFLFRGRPPAAEVVWHK